MNDSARPPAGDQDASHRGLRLVHGMRRKLSEEERNRVADAIVDQMLRSTYKMDVGEPMEGHGPNLTPRNRE